MSSLPTNRLLDALAPDDRALLTRNLQPIALTHKFECERANVAIEHVYFPDSGVVSIVAKSRGGREIEAGVIGREGMTGLPILMGNHRSPQECYVQIAGAGQRISADHLRAALEASATLRPILLRFAQTFMTQVTQTALANGRAKIEERLARWLLMARDRLDTDDVALTHEFIALMLGVRRPGVTETLQALELKGLVHSNRGVITIVDRAGLEEAANGAYGVPEAEYKRLFG